MKYNLHFAFIATLMFAGGSAQSIPTVRVEAQGLQDEGTQLRHKRYQEEHATHQVITKQLEGERLAEEKSRRQRIKAKLAGYSSGKAPVSHGGGQGVLGSINDGTPYSTSKTYIQPQSYRENSYIIGGLSYVEFGEGTTGIHPSGAGYFALGRDMKNGLTAEASFGFASFKVDRLGGVLGGTSVGNREWKMNQYAATLAVKHRISTSRTAPYFGVAVAYTHRNYKEQSYGLSQFSNNSVRTFRSLKSDVIDAGVLGGVELDINGTFFVGGEFRYFTNLSTSQTVESARGRTSKVGNSLEDPVAGDSYYQGSVYTKILF